MKRGGAIWIQYSRCGSRNGGLADNRTGLLRVPVRASRNIDGTDRTGDGRTFVECGGPEGRARGGSQREAFAYVPIEGNLRILGRTHIRILVDPARQLELERLDQQKTINFSDHFKLFMKKNNYLT